MQRLKKLLDYMQTTNAVPNMVWNKIYPFGEVPKDSQKVLVDWLEEHDLGIAPQERLEALMLINRTTLKFLHSDDIRAITPDWYSYEKPKLVEVDFVTETCKFDNEITTGWLDTSGKFVELEWGQHSKWAGEYIIEHNLLDRKREFEKKTNLMYDNDFLIGELNFVLFDCPSSDGHVIITYHNSHLTKAQEDFISDYLIRIKDNYTLKRILKCED